MRIITRLCCLSLLLFSFAAVAQNARENELLLQSQPNGCGSGWSAYIVPDSIPLIQCIFRPACDEHDNCYGKCEGRAQDPSAPQCEYLKCRQGGELEGSSRCRTELKLTRLAVEAQKRRKICDIAIGTKIRLINPGRPVCQAFGYVFEKAVRRFGDAHFQGIDPVPQTLTQSKADYDAAIREFFRQGTVAEFEAFNARPPSLDLPLQYIKGKGLVNVGN